MTHARGISRLTQLLARISARRPLVTVGAWVLLVVVALGIVGQLLGSATTTELRLSGSFESEKATAAVERLSGGPEPVTEIVIVQSDTLTVDDAEFAAKVGTVFAEITALVMTSLAKAPRTTTSSMRLLPIWRGTWFLWIDGRRS